MKFNMHDYAFMNQLVFLPGASGSQGFWQPLRAAALTEYPDQQVIAYPGFDGVTPNVAIQNLYDLQELVNRQIQDDSILIAHVDGRCTGSWVSAEAFRKKLKGWYCWRHQAV